MQALRGRFLQRLVMLEMQQGLSLFYDSFRKISAKCICGEQPMQIETGEYGKL